VEVRYRGEPGPAGLIRTTVGPIVDPGQTQPKNQKKNPNAQY
jgi:hypothetical protein